MTNRVPSTPEQPSETVHLKPKSSPPGSIYSTMSLDTMFRKAAVWTALQLALAGGKGDNASPPRQIHHQFPEPKKLTIPERIKKP